MRYLRWVCLLVLAGSLCGCCCVTTNSGNTRPQPTPVVETQPSREADAQVAQVLVGVWSSEGPHGSLVDPATGAVTGSVYNGQWYVFREDGTFRLVTIGCGSIICGGAVYDGNYRVAGNRLLFSDCRESWYPSAERSNQREAFRNEPREDYEVVFGFDGPDKIEFEDGDTFYRLVEE